MGDLLGRARGHVNGRFVRKMSEGMGDRRSASKIVVGGFQVIMASEVH